VLALDEELDVPIDGGGLVGPLQARPDGPVARIDDLVDPKQPPADPTRGPRRRLNHQILQS
jgi:hypothetical protein